MSARSLKPGEYLHLRLARLLACCVSLARLTSIHYIPSQGPWVTRPVWAPMYFPMEVSPVYCGDPDCFLVLLLFLSSPCDQPSVL